MKIQIDTDKKTLEVVDGGNVRELELYSDEAFEIISHQWVKVGWNQKYQYNFSWFGRPIIQLPEDMIRIQEVIYRLKPDVIVETGIAHGGSLIFYASLCKAMGKGRVIGVDIEIRPHNRKAVEDHELAGFITMVEGSSTDAGIVNQVRQLLGNAAVVLVILDSNHTYRHVYDELTAYSGMVTSGSYIVATDGIMRELHDVPRAGSNWETDNPTCAAIDFAAQNRQFVIEQPAWQFCESDLRQNITHWPSAWLKKV
ncbi:MAG TPA: CmcI family methyltransferase [Candidatus Rifleibacterium sp.]|nr:CmcI family methyltransferase [Candidatus Rifleibacterium sp.]HPT47884.1 CmcI family methyltransferase [Candidatus Rifleibacterium sp.]